MANLRHPFIVGLNYAFQTTKQLFYIMDFVPGGEIFNRLAIHGAFDDDTTRFYATEIVCALEFLHFHSIVYRDLKPDNVLIAGDGHIKLADFGLSKALSVAGHGHDAGHVRSRRAVVDRAGRAPQALRRGRPGAPRRARAPPRRGYAPLVRTRAQLESERASAAAAQDASCSTLTASLSALGVDLAHVELELDVRRRNDHRADAPPFFV